MSNREFEGVQVGEGAMGAMREMFPRNHFIELFSGENFASLEHATEENWQNVFSSFWSQVVEVYRENIEMFSAGDRSFNDDDKKALEAEYNTVGNLMAIVTDTSGLPVLEGRENATRENILKAFQSLKAKVLALPVRS